MKRIVLISFSILLIAATVAIAQSARFRPGDKIELRIGGVPPEEIQAVSAVYTIDPEGFINLPHIGKVKAAGLVLHELQSAIENRYRSEQIYTRPTIIINQQLGERFVNVDGEVKQPQRVPYTEDMTLLAAINAAGGLSEFSDRRVQLSRGGQKQIYDIREIRKDPSKDPKVQPGDVIYVPRSFW